MLTFIGRKLVSSVALLLIVTAATYCLIFSNGTNIARNILGQSATQDQVVAKAHALGLDQNVVLQYFTWLGHLFTGDLGNSYFTQEPVTSILAVRIPVTLSLIIVTLILTIIISVLIGVAAAVNGGWIDKLLQFIGVLGAAVPNFIIAIVLVFVLAINIRAFPATGYVSPSVSVTGWVESIVLPVLAILIGAVAGAAQQFRGAMIDVMKADYIRTLRTRGLPERAIIFRHALRNAASPGLTILSLLTIGLIGGVVVIERVFALPGMGLESSTSSLQGDIPVVMGCVLFTILVVVVVNIAVDLLNGWLNPKARLS